MERLSVYLCVKNKLLDTFHKSPVIIDYGAFFYIIYILYPATTNHHRLAAIVFGVLLLYVNKNYLSCLNFRVSVKMSEGVAFATPSLGL